ncbi:MAG: hypothetical protein EOO10_17980 [Chitinophagaceae bacterium]|nr:MAG: hypothetical protein EOO10_17980 [Chitinophagaceae bacterium]
MENFKITVTDYHGTRSFVIAANSKYQALQEVKTLGEAEISCEPTNEAAITTAIGASPVRLSKKFSAYLASLP